LSTLFKQPPGRFREKVDSDDENKQRNELEGNGESPSDPTFIGS
jgi:hypothetical protein